MQRSNESKNYGLLIMILVIISLSSTVLLFFASQQLEPSNSVSQIKNDLSVQSVAPTFNPTKNGCGLECSWGKGLCQDGFTCVFYDPSCQTPSYGLPSQKSVCVPNSLANITFKSQSCSNGSDLYFTNTNGTPWTPSPSNITSLCFANAPTPTSGPTPTLVPSGTIIPTPTPIADKCGPLDTNSNARIDVFDFAAFVRVYGKQCI